MFGWLKNLSPKVFLREIFQDVDGGFSAKRTVLFVLLITFVVIVCYVAHYGVAISAGKATVYAIPEKTLTFLSGALDRIVDLIKVVIAAVVGERVPQAVAAFKGTGQTPSVTKTEQ